MTSVGATYVARRSSVGVILLGLAMLFAVRESSAFETHSSPNGFTLRIISATIGLTIAEQKAVKFVTVYNFGKKRTIAYRFVRLEDCGAQRFLPLWSRNVADTDQQDVHYIEQIVAADTLGFQVAKEACAAVGQGSGRSEQSNTHTIRNSSQLGVSSKFVHAPALSESRADQPEEAHWRALTLGLASSLLLNYQAEILAGTDLLFAMWGGGDAQHWRNHRGDTVTLRNYGEFVRARRTEEAQMQLAYPEFFEFSRYIGTACLAGFAYGVCYAVSRLRQRREVI